MRYKYHINIYKCPKTSNWYHNTYIKKMLQICFFIFVDYGCDGSEHLFRGDTGDDLLSGRDTVYESCQENFRPAHIERTHTTNVVLVCRGSNPVPVQEENVTSNMCVMHENKHKLKELFKFI